MKWDNIILIVIEHRLLLIAEWTPVLKGSFSPLDLLSFLTMQWCNSTRHTMACDIWAIYVCPVEYNLMAFWTMILLDTLYYIPILMLNGPHHGLCRGNTYLWTHKIIGTIENYVLTKTSTMTLQQMFTSGREHNIRLQKRAHANGKMDKHLMRCEMLL